MQSEPNLQDAPQRSVEENEEDNLLSSVTLNPRDQNFMENKKNILIPIFCFGISLLIIFLLVFEYKKKSVNMYDDQDFVQKPFLDWQLNKVLNQLKRVPKSRNYAHINESPELIEMEYAALRLNNYPENEQFRKAQIYQNQRKYKLSQVDHQASICIPFQITRENQNMVNKLLVSVTRQQYLNYQLFIYNPNNVPITISSTKIQAINKEMGDLRECERFDIVLILRKGQMIGRFVLQRINAAYQNSSIQMTYSNVLGFCPFHKIPISQSSIIPSADEDHYFTQYLFSHFLWSFRIQHLSEIMRYSKQVQEACQQDDEIDLSAFGLKVTKNETIKKISQFDIFIENVQKKEQNKCLLKVMSSYTSINPTEIQAITNGKRFEKIFQLPQESVQLVAKSLKEEPSKLSLWHHSPGQDNPRRPNERTYYVYRLSLDPKSQSYRQIQYEQYDRKYKIGSYKKELPFCVVCVGRNINNNRRVEKFFGSVARQNYSNYHVVYVDDASDDKSSERMRELIFTEYPEMKNKVTIVENRQRVYSLANRYKAITQYCNEDEIIIDIDADDELIGSQVLKLFNALYQAKPDVWFIYTNNVLLQQALRQPLMGTSQEINSKYLAIHTLRLHLFTISSIRSFTRKLFMKLDVDDLKEANGSFYKWVADYFIFMSMVEMAGPERIYFCDEMALKYYPNDNITTINAEQKKKYAIIAKKKKPYNVLESIDSLPERVNPEISDFIFQELLISSTRFYDELEKNARNMIGYFPRIFQPREQKKLDEIKKQNKKIIIGSNSTLIDLAIFAEYLRTYKDDKTSRLETYFYDNRYQTLFFRNAQIPTLVVIEVKDPLKYFETLFDSLISQEYNDIMFIFVCQQLKDQNYIFSFAMKHYPMFLEKAFFLQKSQYPNLLSILEEFCKIPSILVQLSIKSELIGTEVFRFVNGLFHQNPGKMMIVAPSMMQISTKRIQVIQTDSEFLSKSQDYLNYHTKTKGFLALKVFPKERFSDQIPTSRIHVTENVFTSFYYEKQIYTKYKFEQQKEKEEILNKLKQKVLGKGQHKERTFQSYLGQWYYKNPYYEKIASIEKYLYQKKYDLGKYASKIPFCVVSLAVNPLNYKKFFQSLQRQNYENYSLVLGYLNPSFSAQSETNEYFFKMKNKIRAIHHWNEPFDKTFVQIKASLISQYCRDDEFVVDIDGNDQFVGRQVFGLLNTFIYQRPQTWFLMTNSLYQSQSSDMILPSSPNKVQDIWDYFYLDRIKVYKKGLFINAASRPFVVEENHVNLMMYQLSGQRFHYLNEFLSFDTKTDVYGYMNDENQFFLWKLLNHPVQQLRFPEDKKAAKAKKSIIKEEETSKRSVEFTQKRLISSAEILERKTVLNEQQIEHLLHQTMKSHVNNKVEDPIYLFNKLRKYPFYESYLRAEQQYYKKVYKIDKETVQKPICIISTNNQNKKSLSVGKFIQTFAHANYKNMQVVFFDNTAKGNLAPAMQKYTKRTYPTLVKKLIVIKNNENLSLNQRKNMMIRNECGKAEIIVDYGFEEELVGEQFFKVLNSLYQSSKNWFIYTNYFKVKNKQLVKGRSEALPDEFIYDHSYRRKTFVTFGLRSFRKQLFLKIDEKDLIASKDANELVLYYALTELSGPKHSVYLPETPVFVQNDGFAQVLYNKNSNLMNARIQAPFKALKDLSADAARVQLKSSKEEMEKEIIEWTDYYRQQKNSEVKQTFQ